jgi:hypothetical protein
MTQKQRNSKQKKKSGGAKTEGTEYEITIIQKITL